MENMTEQEKFVVAAAGVFKECLELLNQRSKKYTGAGDPFRNFDDAADLAGVGTEQGILVRLGDKIGRIKNGFQARREAQGDLFQEFKDESLRDSIADAIDYLAILRIWLDSGEGANLDVPVTEAGLDDLAVPSAEETEEDSEKVWVGFEPDGDKSKGWFQKFVGR